MHMCALKADQLTPFVHTHHHRTDYHDRRTRSWPSLCPSRRWRRAWRCTAPSSSGSRRHVLPSFVLCTRIRFLRACVCLPAARAGCWCCSSVPRGAPPLFANNHNQLSDARGGGAMTGLVLVEGEANEGEEGGGLAHRIYSIVDHAINLNVRTYARGGHGAPPHTGRHRATHIHNPSFFLPTLPTHTHAHTAGPGPPPRLPRPGRDAPDEPAVPRRRVAPGADQGLRAGR